MQKFIHKKICAAYPKQHAMGPPMPDVSVYLFLHYKSALAYFFLWDKVRPGPVTSARTWNRWRLGRMHCKSIALQSASNRKYPWQTWSVSHQGMCIKSAWQELPFLCHHAKLKFVMRLQLLNSTIHLQFINRGGRGSNWPAPSANSRSGWFARRTGSVTGHCSRSTPLAVPGLQICIAKVSYTKSKLHHKFFQEGKRNL